MFERACRRGNAFLGMSDDRAGLLRDPEFVKFWGGQSISLLGSQFTLLALPIAAAVTLRATPVQMGLLTALQFAPGLLFSMAAGVWLDRTRRRPVLVVTQVASALVLASVPLAAVAHVLTMGQLFAVAFLAGTASTIYVVAQVSFLPTLVGRQRLVEANARYQTSWTVASLIGPGLAGVAVQLLTAPLAIAVDASSFVVGAVTAGWIRVTEPVVERQRGRHAVREAMEGLAQLWRQPLVRGITGTLLIANAGGGMASAVTVLLFVGQIGLPPAQFGLVFGAGSLSSLVGSVLIRPLQRRGGLGPVMVLSTILVAAGTTVRAGAAFTAPPLTFPILVAGALVSGFGLMTYNVPQQAIRQAVVPDRMLGRTSAGVTLAVYAGSVAASLAGGLLGQFAGLRWTLVVATAITVACVLPTAIGPVAALRDVPAGPPETAARDAP
jgi:MFS family permease